jgi:hemin uptake protein HemP
MSHDPASADLPTPRPAPPTEADRRCAGPAPSVVRITSERLFAGTVEVQIEHRGGIYRLKQTSLGKLILTK